VSYAPVLEEERHDVLEVRRDTAQVLEKTLLVTLTDSEKYPVLWKKLVSVGCWGDWRLLWGQLAQVRGGRARARSHYEGGCVC
jgi:hypothetical protein